MPSPLIGFLQVFAVAKNSAIAFRGARFAYFTIMLLNISDDHRLEYDQRLIFALDFRQFKEFFARFVFQ